VPPGKRERIRNDDLDIIAEARIAAADLGVLVLDQKPMIDSPLALVKLESDDHSFLGEQIVAHI
jgi:hypothetical protein